MSDLSLSLSFLNARITGMNSLAIKWAMRACEICRESISMFKYLQPAFFPLINILVEILEADKSSEQSQNELRFVMESLLLPLLDRYDSLKGSYKRFFTNTLTSVGPESSGGGVDRISELVDNQQYT